MLLALTFCLSLLQDDPPILVPNLDSAVRGMVGFQLPKELKVVADDVFLRRLMKDLVDAVPTDDEVRSFVDDRDPKKRSKKINGLLEDDRFAAFWAKRFEDVFFVDVVKNPWTELSMLTTGQQGKIVEAFTTWLASRLKADKPWTEIVGSMLDARGTPAGDPALGYLLSFRRGKGFEVEFAENMPQHLLGIRLRCARCHDHPFDKWRQEDFYGLAAFVVRQRARLGNTGLEVAYADEGEMKLPGPGGNPDALVRIGQGGIAPPVFLFGGTAGKNDDRMKVLAGFMTHKLNSQLPRMLVNRAWGWLFGVGLVNGVDDFNLKNKPLSLPLLELLTKSVAENKYSVKSLVRLICNTQAYQQPTPEEAPDGESFRHLAARKRLPRNYPAPLASSTLPLSLTLPADWVRVREGGGATKGLFLIPDKSRPGWTVELKLLQGRLPEEQWTQWSGHLEQPKKTPTVLTGKDGVKITFTELSGANFCRLEASGPVDFVVWVAVVEAAKPLTFQAAAPAEVLAPWRDDFIALLKSSSQK